VCKETWVWLQRQEDIIVRKIIVPSGGERISGARLLLRRKKFRSTPRGTTKSAERWTILLENFRQRKGTHPLKFYRQRGDVVHKSKTIWNDARPKMRGGKTCLMQGPNTLCSTAHLEKKLNSILGSVGKGASISRGSGKLPRRKGVAVGFWEIAFSGKTYERRRAKETLKGVAREDRIFENQT